MSTNTVVLVGRWSKDLELKFLPGSGKAVASGTIAVNRRFNPEGKRQADFIPVVIWGKQAENAANWTTKGSLVSISGSIQVRDYEAKDGTKRYVTEVIADEVTFLDKKGDKPVSENKIDLDNDITEVDGSDIPF